MYHLRSNSQIVTNYKLNADMDAITKTEK